jgi:hypothetical protein
MALPQKAQAARKARRDVSFSSERARFSPIARDARNPSGEETKSVAHQIERKHANPLAGFNLGEGLLVVFKKRARSQIYDIPRMSSSRARHPAKITSKPDMAVTERYLSLISCVEGPL